MGKKGKGKKGKGDAPKAESNIPSWEPPARKEIPPPPPPRRSDLPKDVHAAAASGDRERVNAWLGEAEYGHVDATCSHHNTAMTTHNYAYPCDGIHWAVQAGEQDVEICVGNAVVRGGAVEERQSHWQVIM